MTSDSKVRVGRVAVGEDADYLKVGEVARSLSVSQMTVYRQIKDGKLPMVRMGNSMRVHVKDLESYIHKQTVSYGSKSEATS